MNCVRQFAKKVTKIKGGKMKLQIPESILNTPLTYKQLCELLSIQPKTGKSKIYQIKNIELYCDLIITSHPTKYIINEIYDEAIIKERAKFQAPFEILIMELFKANNYQTLYLTNSRLLECMKLVNSNYRIIKNPQLRNRLPFKTDVLYEGATKSGEILKKWLMRALEKMETYGYLKKRRGYCLVKKIIIGKEEITIIINVPLDSELEQKIMECQRQTYIKLNLQFTKERRWVPPHMKPQYQVIFDKEVREQFNNEYVGAFEVNVLTPNTFGIKETLSAYESERLINGESQRKIGATKELNYMTGHEREQLIKEIIARPPSINYQELIKNPRT